MWRIVGVYSRAVRSALLQIFKEPKKKEEERNPSVSVQTLNRDVWGVQEVWGCIFLTCVASAFLRDLPRVSLKYAFKLMRDLITHLHSAYSLSLSLSLRLFSPLIFHRFPLPPSPTRIHPPHLHPPTGGFDLLSLLQGTHYLLQPMECLKRPETEEGQEERRPKTSTSLHLPLSTFCFASLHHSSIYS